MSCTSDKKTPIVRVTNYAPIGTDVFEPLTDWLPALGVSDVRLTLERLADQGDNLDLTPAIQTTSGLVDESGTFGRGDWSTFGSTFAGSLGDGDSGQQSDVSAALSGKSMFRLGIAHKRASGSSLGYGAAEVGLEEQHSTCGSVVGSVLNQTLVVDDVKRHLPLTDWLPALDLSDALGAFRIKAAASGDARSQMYIQTADYDVTEPNAPVLLGSVQQGAVDFNTGAVTVTTQTAPAAGTKPMKARLGLALWLNAGGADNEEVVVSGIVQVRYS